MVSITYDKDADVFYIKISNNKVVRTISLGNDKFLDVDERGEIVGFEVLNSTNTGFELEEVIARTQSIKVTA